MNSRITSIGKSFGEKPSAIYVFTVMSLAAFLLLFTIARRPKIEYFVGARFAMPIHDELPGSSIEEIRRDLLQPETVLEALFASQMINGDPDNAMLEIAADIASRMQVRELQPQDNRRIAQVALVTNHPVVGTKLLDQMMLALSAKEGFDVTVSSSVASRVRGSAISPTGLFLLIGCAALVGLGSLIWFEKSLRSATLLTQSDIEQSVNLPVIADFTKTQTIPAREARNTRRRQFLVALRTAEVAITATILLMLVNVATVQAFFDLLSRDPLGAYSEALERVLS